MCTTCTFMIVRRISGAKIPLGPRVDREDGHLNLPSWVLCWIWDESGEFWSFLPPQSDEALVMDPGHDNQSPHVTSEVSRYA